MLWTKLHDKRDDFNFPIVNFPFTCICSNISAAPAYGVYYISLIRYDISELVVPIMMFLIEDYC